ncbi:MAG: hypothetical protein JW943_07600 [Deltaproteobacteria bacterium]|nr:hypothetical protein [Deltaproteobacteria bacterium]
MKKIFTLLCITLLAVLFSGCGEMLRKEIVTQSLTARSDIFAEVNKDEPVPAEFGVVQINASIKTRTANHYLINLGTSDVGKPAYPFVINIDGQAMEWRIDGKKENTPRFENGKEMSDGGEGIRYVLNKTIRLKKGSHRMFVGLSRDNIIQEFDLNVKEGRSTLEIIPVYKFAPMIDIRRPEGNEASFVYGINRLDIHYDGAQINTLPDTVLRRVIGK